MLSAIIVDDEPNAASFLQNKLSQLWPELEIAGTAVNGRQALQLAAQEQPDIAFLDIHMPGLSGLEVASALPQDTRIVFVTAFDEFAVEAFQTAAIDYLLKPVSDDRLQQTIQRLKHSQQQDRNEIVSLLQQMTSNQPEHLQWLRTGLDDTTELVSVDEVVFFQAEQKYTTVATANKEHLIRKSIKDLERSLDPNKFWRVHRATIVRVDQISAAKRDLRGRYSLSLRDRSEVIRTSQTYSKLFKHM